MTFCIYTKFYQNKIKPFKINGLATFSLCEALQYVV